MLPEGMYVIISVVVKNNGPSPITGIVYSRGGDPGSVWCSASLMINFCDVINSCVLGFAACGVRWPVLLE